MSAPQLGKSLGLALWLLAGAWKDAASPWVSWWTAPTYQQAEHGFNRYVVAFARSAGILDPRKAPTTRPPLSARLINSQVLEARSWEREEGLYGPPVGRIAVDEFGQLTDPAYSALSSRRAETISTGRGYIRYAGNVGEMGGTAERLWNMAKAGAPGFACRSWTWRDRALAHSCACGDEALAMDASTLATPGPPAPDAAAPHKDACGRGIYIGFIAREAGRMSSPQFRTLYEAEWVDWNQLPVYTFDRQVHVWKLEDALELQAALPLDISCDFNVDPMAWVVGQHLEGEAWALDEIAIPGGATTVAACKEVIARYPDTSLAVTIYGDASGGARKTSAAATDYYQIQQILGGYYPSFRMLVPAANPPVNDRVNAFNAMLLSADGRVRYHLHPRCTNLANDLARVSRKPGTSDIDKSDKKLTHFSDADGYRIAWEFPVAGASQVSEPDWESGPLLVDRKY